VGEIVALARNIPLLENKRCHLWVINKPKGIFAPVHLAHINNGDRAGSPAGRRTRRSEERFDASELVRSVVGGRSGQRSGVMLEKNRMQLFQEVQFFLDRARRN
jgi:hypothetical protein